jgi:hypothetical protein
MLAMQDEVAALKAEVASLKAESEALKKDKAETWYRLTKEDVASVYECMREGEEMPDEVYARFLNVAPADKYGDLNDYSDGSRTILEENCNVVNIEEESATP